jgi:protoporphyrinogen oxidase
MTHEKGDYVAKVVILGAGLTGLSAAYHFEQAGFSDFEIFEKQEEAGGLLRSFNVDGFTFDYTGHLLHINDEYFSSFINTITSIDTFLNVTRKTGIYSHNSLTDYPFQMNLHGLPNEVIYECIEGYINRHTYVRKPKNFHAWVLKYFGAGMGKHFFFPYNSKILAYDVRKVLPSWTGRFVPQTSLDAVLRGALEKKETKNVGYNSQFFYPKSGGIQHLIKSLEGAIKAKPKLHHQVAAIDVKTKTITFTNGATTRYESLISTLPLNELLMMISGSSHRHYKTAAEKLLCNSVINFNLGFKQPHLTDKHWIYYPEKQFPFYRMGFWHNINATSVKPGHTAIYGELSYLGKNTSKPARINLVASAVTKALALLNINEQDVVVRKDLHLTYAYVIYDAWREKHLANLLKNLADDGILSTGRYGGWKYSSMQEAVIDGKLASEQLLPNIVAARVTKENLQPTPPKQISSL